MEEKKICYYCGNEIEEGEELEVTLNNGEVVHACRDCHSENFIICEDCGEVVHVDDSYYITSTGEHVCESCYNDNYITCEDCGDVVHVDNSHYISSTCEHVCEDCYSDNYFTCDVCGEVYHVDERTF